MYLLYICNEIGNSTTAIYSGWLVESYCLVNGLLSQIFSLWKSVKQSRDLGIGFDRFTGMMNLLDEEQNDALAESVVADPSKLSMLIKISLSMEPNSLLKGGAPN